ncbi:endonuclease/exonuclease/phosphatase family protein [Roseococcus sp. YIM B11640]|uniref:endonuclease/exonuclease/phosphatase family protein n=1 Tax=Roseococcus sp. YIM B11640 TaxID=3133973 RepID=UPI003C79CBA2
MSVPPNLPTRTGFPLELHRSLLKLHGAYARRRASFHPAASAPRPEGVIVAASYNVHKCVGVDNRFDPNRIASVIAELDCDVLALQEADRRFGVRTGLLDAGALERKTGLTMLPVADNPGGHGWHGNALLVREGRLLRLRRIDLPGAEPRGALVAELKLPAGKLRVVAAHLGLMRRHRAMQAATLLAAIEEDNRRARERMPTLLMGDLNEWRPGVPSSLIALESYFGSLAGGEPSFPSRLPFLALDRILGNPHNLVMSVEAHSSHLARLASDHLPLRARIDLAACQDAARAAAA